MKLEDQVCSLELAKRLKELGVKQDGYFWWVNGEIVPSENRSYFDGKLRDYGCGCCCGKENVTDYYSAFTIAELGEMLPANYRIHKEQGSWYVTTQRCLRCDGQDYFHKDQSMANSVAAMLIYLLERGIIKND